VGTSLMEFPAATTEADIDPSRFRVHKAAPRGFDQAYLHEGVGGYGPLVLVHGWPETKRIWWRVVAPLAALGFEVIVPDLRGFGDSDVGPDGFHDVPAHSRDVHALVHDYLGHSQAVLVGGDLGGAVIQDLALRFPGFARQLLLFNCPLPFDKRTMAGMESRAPMESSDYLVRQGTDPNGLAFELDDPAKRRRYVASFYTSRFWAHPGAFLIIAGIPPSRRFSGSLAVDFHTQPFADGAKFRAGLGCYESVFSELARSEPALMERNPNVRCLVLFGPSDHVIYPDFDRMAGVVFPDHVGPFLLRNCGHFLPWEAPGPLVSALGAFVGPRL
jgi:pimeloyl-ACP methyl ester carboxylesterase